MSSRKTLVTLLSSIVLVSPFLTTTTQAQGNPTYCTWITPNDLRSTNGAPLRSVDQIIQQDRANVHKFGNPDRDQVDPIFTSYEKRLALAEAVRRSDISPGVRNAILNGNATVCVYFYGNTVDIVQ
ncbi:MAG: hypothetical protein F6K21_29070 [Symploca sp. SIO2D2]|nr:hypothetical protein [Symploca sp. SIO2D2]